MGRALDDGPIDEQHREAGREPEAEGEPGHGADEVPEHAAPGGEGIRDGVRHECPGGEVVTGAGGSADHGALLSPSSPQTWGVSESRTIPDVTEARRPGHAWPPPGRARRHPRPLRPG